jgi:alpha-N-arabinofuranosidase
MELLYRRKMTTLGIDPSVPVSTVSTTLYGLMTEEIHPEMVRNRALSTLHHGLESWPAFAHGDALIKQEWYPGSGPSKTLSGILKIAISHMLHFISDAFAGKVEPNKP